MKKALQIKRMVSVSDAMVSESIFEGEKRIVELLRTLAFSLVMHN